MITVKVSGRPILTVAGSTFTATVPVSAFDYANVNDEWPIAQGTLTVSVTTSMTLAQFKTALIAEANTWRTSLASMQTLRAKLDKIEGLEL